MLGGGAVCEMTEGAKARKEEVSAASDGGEGRQTFDLLFDGALRKREIEGAVLCADERIALIAESLEVGIVGPYVHGELKLTHKAGAADKGGDTSLDAVVGNTFRQGGTVGAAAANHLVPFHALGGVAGIHPAYVRTYGAAVSVRVHLAVVEVVGALPIAAEFGVVLV